MQDHGLDTALDALLIEKAAPLLDAADASGARNACSDSYVSGGELEFVDWAFWVSPSLPSFSVVKTWSESS